MAANIFSGESDWSVSSRVFHLLLDAAKGADINPASRFLQLIDQFEAVQVINLDELDDPTRADVLDALLKGTAAVLDRLRSESDALLPPIPTDELGRTFRELEHLLSAAASEP